MDDLRVLPGPGAPHGLVIPAGELIERFSRSSGPGGQHVNTTDSRVQLSLDLATTTALDETQRARALRALAPALSGGGVLTITAEEHRSQHRNRTAARERLADALRGAVAPAVLRRPTKPTRGSRRRRLQHEQRRAEIKRNRRRPDLD